MDKKLISLIVPMYNEEATIPNFFREIRSELDTLDVEYEIVCIDDGSSDQTLFLLEEASIKDPHIKVISFSRNFGKEAAMTAGIDYASGDAVIPIDADLQDPPELIKEMITKWSEGYEVVLARRSSRSSDSLLKRLTARLFYSMFNKVSELDIPQNVGDYRLMDKKVVAVLKDLPEKDRFMKGLYSWPGYKHAFIDFERPERVSGDTKFNYWKLWNFALSGITSFSTVPIRFGTYFGIFVAFIAFLYGLFIIVRTLYLGIDVPGYASLLVVTLFLGGIQLFFMGLLGEYVGRIYLESKNRPIYIVAKKYGFPDENR